GDQIFFTSDRDTSRRLNIFSYDLKSKETKQVTFFKDYDVMWPSMGGDSIVFENAGYLYLLNADGGEPRKLSITVPGDETLTQPKWVDAQEAVTGLFVSPNGKRLGLEARGDIFTVPAKEGNTRNLTHSSNAHDKYATWSPDAKWIAYVSDQSGEDEIY